VCIDIIYILTKVKWLVMKTWSIKELLEFDFINLCPLFTTETKVVLLFKHKCYDGTYLNSYFFKKTNDAIIFYP